MKRSRLLWVAAGLLVAALVVLWLSSGKGLLERKPEPTAAFVAIAVGESAAEVGRVTIPRGEEFTLHAVLEAETGDGEKVYYTEAPALRIDGREIAADAIRHWDRAERSQILWFTVEGARPFLETETREDLLRFSLEEFFRPDWPQAWSIKGRVKPLRARLMDDSGHMEEVDFGTQRFHVRIELFGPSSQIAPEQRIKSPGAGDVEAAGAAFPTVAVELPGGLRIPSRVFGLTQIETTRELAENAATTLNGLHESELAFTRTLLLHTMLERSDAKFHTLDWSAIDLAENLSWEALGIEAGHLLRAGGRVVVLYRDRTADGVLGHDDLCFDFDEGAAVRALGEIFSGEGLVEWAGV